MAEKRPKKKEYTYANNLAAFKSRIDRFYLTSDLEINYKKRTQIRQNYPPDDGMITLNVHKKKKMKRKRRPSYWKLNSTILENKDFYLFHKNRNKEKKNTKTLPFSGITDKNLN